MKRIRGRHIALAAACIAVGLGLGAAVIAGANAIGGYHDNHMDEQFDASVSSAAAAETSAIHSYQSMRATVGDACENLVRDKLKSPASARFELGDTNLHEDARGGLTGTLSGTVDSQNGYGAMMRSDWTCTMQPGSSIGSVLAGISGLTQRN
ncbi:hypothetical protein [Nocardia vaccinii]|uniref:hypothetical protein n=1 Tax=Nocardia vaccinii TaxID=1822 RepID=UPI00082E81DE|nr:hypothetical protein [Nocardia vaccinii]